MSDTGRSPRSSSDPARKLLLELCRRNGSGTDGQGDRLADPGFRSAILELAARHRVLGLLLHAVVDPGAEGAGKAAAQGELSDLYLHCRRRAAFFELRRDQLVEHLREQGIGVVVLKGAALAGTVYDDPVQRDQGDFDLLVRPEDLRRTVAAIESAGYRKPSPQSRFEQYLRFHFHVPLLHPDAHITEVHWAMARATSPFHLDPRAVLERAVKLERSGAVTLTVPCPEHQLLHIVLQNLQENFSSLGRLVDIDRIVAATPGLDWDLLLSAARNGGMQFPTALSLQLARRILHAPVPEEPVRELIPSPVVRFHLAIMRPSESFLSQRLCDTFAASQLHEFWLVHGAARRARQLFAAMRSGAAATFPETERLSSLARLLGLCKAAILQLGLYVRAGLWQASRSGKAQMRFWSSQARSSERL